MAAPLHIRPATREDRPTVVSFHRALYLEHRREVMPPALEPLYAYRDFERVLREDVDSLLANGGAAVLLAERAGAPVGYISGHVESEPRRLLARRGVVEDWYVLPEERGTGVGRELFETLVAVFREVGCEVVESATWPFNAGARAAHEKLGFVEVEVRYRMRLPEE